MVTPIMAQSDIYYTVDVLFIAFLKFYNFVSCIRIFNVHRSMTGASVFWSHRWDSNVGFLIF